MTGRLVVFAILGVVFGPIAVFVFKVVSNPRGKHQHRMRDRARAGQRRALPRHSKPQRKDRTMTTQQPEPRDNNGGPERVHPGNVEGDVVNGDKVEGDIVEPDEVDHDPESDDDDTDAPGHRREDSETDDE